MTQQKKTSSDLEEQIQSLAGDIYVQIEDKVSAFVANYSASTEITNDIVEEHATFQALKTEFAQLKVDLDKTKVASQNEASVFELRHQIEVDRELVLEVGCLRERPRDLDLQALMMDCLHL